MATHPESSNESDRCRSCGAPLGDDTSPICWLCDGETGHRKSESTIQGRQTYPALPPPLPVIEPERFTYTLGTLMLAMTLVAVLCGLCVHWPGLGIPLAFLAVPAWIRASRSLDVDPETQLSRTLGDKLSRFFSSLGVVFLVCAASGMAGFAACTSIVIVGSGFGGGSDLAVLPFGLLIGGIGFLVLMVVLWMTWWPKRKVPKDHGPSVHVSHD